MSIGFRRPAKLFNKLPERRGLTGVSRSYGEQQKKMPGQYLLLRSSGLNLLTDLSTRQPSPKQALAHTSSLAEVGKVLPDRRGQELQLLYLCHSFFTFCFADDAVVLHCQHGLCKALTELWGVVSQEMPQRPKDEEPRTRQAPGLHCCFFTEASLGFDLNF